MSYFTVDPIYLWFTFLNVSASNLDYFKQRALKVIDIFKGALMGVVTSCKSPSQLEFSLGQLAQSPLSC